MDIKP